METARKWVKRTETASGHKSRLSALSCSIYSMTRSTSSQTLLTFLPPILIVIDDCRPQRWKIPSRNQIMAIETEIIESRAESSMEYRLARFLQIINLCDGSVVVCLASFPLAARIRGKLLDHLSKGQHKTWKEQKKRQERPKDEPFIIDTKSKKSINPN